MCGNVKLFDMLGVSFNDKSLPLFRRRAFCVKKRFNKYNRLVIIGNLERLFYNQDKRKRSFKTAISYKLILNSSKISHVSLIAFILV